jgi:hypothetical protein
VLCSEKETGVEANFDTRFFFRADTESTEEAQRVKIKRLTDDVGRLNFGGLKKLVLNASGDR